MIISDPPLPPFFLKNPPILPTLHFYGENLRPPFLQKFQKLNKGGGGPNYDLIAATLVIRST